MTSPVRHQPVGPINAGDNVTLAINVAGTLYVPIYDARSSDMAFFSYLSYNGDGTINSSVNGGTLMVFKVTEESGGFSFDLISPNLQSPRTKLLWKSLSGTNVLSLQSPSPPNLVSLTSAYQRPPPPGIVFSGADYSFTTPSSVSIRIPYYSTSLPDVLAYSTANVYVVSLRMHARSSGDTSVFTCSAAITDRMLCLQTFFCSVCEGNNCGGVSNCTSSLVPTNAWTRLLDCQNDYNYDYCKGTETCGKCYGPCGNSTDSCQLAGKTFVCSLVPVSGVPLTPLGPAQQPLAPLTPSVHVVPTPSAATSYWWVFALVGLIIVIILGTIVYKSYSERRTSETYASNLESVSYGERVPNS